MKVLYISEGRRTCDYMRDMVFHGLRSLLGDDVIDVHPIDTMYQGYPLDTCYGLGFTLYGLLPDIPVDRSDIPTKIRTQYFDRIVWGSIHRSIDYLPEALEVYYHDQLWAIDGEDHPGVLTGLGIPMFKRELYHNLAHCHPIQFAIPGEKILGSPPRKTKLIAPLDPLDRRTYIYTKEADYYAQYAASNYAATMRKAGFDCLRHYEILANWCLPYYRAYEALAEHPLICRNLPGRELMLIKHAWECLSNHPSYTTLISLYDDLIGPVMKVTRQKLTTTALAEYVLSTMGLVANVQRSRTA